MEFTPNSDSLVNPGPTLEEQAVNLGITEAETPAETQEAPPQENLILGKFANQEALAQAYTELEQKQGAQAPASEALTQASNYYEEHGQLHEDHYNQLGQAGLSRAMIDQYIAGHEAQRNQQTVDHYASVGGEDNYQQMAGWMSRMLPDTEIEAYNRVMEGGTDAERGVLISGMYSRFQAANSQNYTQVQGQIAPEAPMGFESRGQVMAAFEDPRYETDQAFREEVEVKLAHTPESVF